MQCGTEPSRFRNYWYHLLVNQVPQLLSELVNEGTYHGSIPLEKSAVQIAGLMDSPQQHSNCIMTD